MTSAEWADAARDMPHLSRRDLAHAAGFDPHRDDNAPRPAHLDLAADDPWMVALTASVVEARALEAVCEPCADNSRCDTCQDRMCAEMGPEPRACGLTCCDCPCDCQGCRDARIDLRAELQRQLEKDAN